MKSISYSLLILSICLAALLPNGMVLCKKNGSIAVEFEQGESCSCSDIITDLIEKFCCDEDACHENETVTDNCHSQQISNGNCQDTKFDVPTLIRSANDSFTPPIRLFEESNYFSGHEFYSSLILGLHKPIDVGKFYTNPLRSSNSPLSTQRTIVLTI
jgi:hypothetical protein